MKFLAPILLLAIPALAKTAESLAEDAACPKIPKLPVVSEKKLTDPFRFVNGRRVRSERDFACRQREIKQLIQDFELGAKPGKPDKVTSTYENGTLTVTVTDKGKSASFNSAIQYPTSGKAPYAAIIGIGGSWVPKQDDVVYINFPNDEVAAQETAATRGVGKFYNIYGSNATAGSLMGWAWGVSRLIDALEDQPDLGIDTDRLAITGCSRNGKGALTVGAFDNRIALTLPQEAGTGGDGCWRLADHDYASKVNVQTASEIVQESTWMSKDFEKYTSNVNQLPFDHHLLAGLVAPRGILVLNNDIDWLGPTSTYGCMKTARKIWEAYGEEDSFGYSKVGNHSHCLFPESQTKDVTAFTNRFLRNKNDKTGVFYSDVPETGFNESQWVDWEVPEFRKMPIE